MSTAESLTAREAALTGLFAAIDAKDADRFVGFLTPGGSFRFGSAPAAVGRDAVREAVAGFFESIRGLSHTLHKVIPLGNTLVAEGEVSYARHDGSTITLPFVDVFEYDGDLISEYKIYMDIAPLFAV